MVDKETERIVRECAHESYQVAIFLDQYDAKQIDWETAMSLALVCLVRDYKYLVDQLALI